ncbi:MULTISPECIES: hypothetical protein [Mycobacteriaceae]|uniref:Uncharacterized protein n=1 Tax=Mycolicibacillus parakoreensis TaxID=1069221 RepID=A0ABY3U5K0_9MYCO|nr:MULTISPECIES: hypothetical protein [Mycobacteriaceae]MCV7316208.1 hypothetical protein [Mycolicibacillus parakoreensis]ULN54799.1 hypothetical protein MIU77_18815 [Mycolicibacillus parakoreensis]
MTDTSFPAGALYGRPDPALPVAAVVATAAGMLEAARKSDPSPAAKPWRATFRAECTDTDWTQYEPLIAAIEAAQQPVLAALAQRHRLRAAVLDSWATRLYAPPLAVQPPAMLALAAAVHNRPPPQPSVPCYQLDAMLAELQSVLVAAEADHAAAAEFDKAALAAISAAADPPDQQKAATANLAAASAKISGR